MWKVLLLLLHLLNLGLNKPLEAGEDIFDYDLLENYVANATAFDDMMTMEELLARIRKVQASRIPKDKLLDLLEDEEDEVGGIGENAWDVIGNPPPQPPSPESKEEAGCVVHYHYHYH